LRICAEPPLDVFGTLDNSDLGSLTKSSLDQRDKEAIPERKQLVLAPKAQPPSEDARWRLAPEVSVPVGRTDQRRAVVHWTIREAQSEIAPGVRRGGTPQIMADSAYEDLATFWQNGFDDDSAYQEKA